jgi:class 3 adenylate cyclase/tetratricopeptide (TPR) repeat protein
MPDPGRPTETLAIMMTDVAGSTALRLDRGDVIADEILRIQAAIVRDQLRRHDGQERQFLGDGFLLFFPSPVAAVDCAVDIQRALEEHNAAEPERRVRIRIGIHVGEVSTGVRELYGQAVHAVARVMAEAAGGQILASGNVRDQIERDGDQSRTYRFVDSGLFWLKGFPERWRLYEVTRAEAGVGRPSTAAPPLTPLVERDNERATLRRAADEASAGRGRLVLVAGEPGVGKSRLVMEIAREAEARGMRVLTGHCVEMEGAAPYLPYVEMIEQAVSSPRSPLALRDALAGVAPEIARIAPALRRAMPDIAAPVELPPELARRYVWNSLGEFLARGAQRQPLLLVLEDLHWADESTALLTEYLAPLVAQLPVLILGTYRDSEVGFSHPLARVISQLVRQRLIDRIGLGALSYSGVRAMVEELAGQRAPEQLVQVINNETEGNPFFVEEVYLHLVESGVLFDEHGGVRKDLAVDEVALPEGIRLVLGERLERLSPSTRTALTAAAILGRVFAPDLVADVAGEDPESVIDAFDEAEGARLIAPATGNGHLAFRHELIRQTLLAELSTLKRERLHLRAADTIERRYADGIDPHVGDLAHHLSLSGRSADPARVVRYLSLAGRRAYDAAAFEDAVAHYQQALPRVAPDAREERAELLERLALALRSAGRWDDALPIMNDALDVYEELGRTDSIGRLAWAMVEQLTWTARVPDAVQVARHALSLLGDVASADRARLIGLIAWALSLGGDYATAKGMFHQARALAEQVGDERAVADVLHLQTVHHFAHAEFVDGVEVGLRAAEVFDREGDLWNLCSVQGFVVMQDGMAGSREQADRLAEKALGIAERIGHLGAAFMLLDDRAREKVSLADLVSVEAIGLRIIDTCERGGLPWRYIGHCFVGLAAHLRGDSGRADAELRRAVELEPPGAFAGQAVSLWARHLAHTGRVDEVMALYESAQSTFDSTDRMTVGAWNCMLALEEALYLSGHRHEAATMSPLIDRELEIGPGWTSFDCRLVRTRAAIAAVAGCRWEEAERHFTTAEDQARRTSNNLEVVDLRRLRARMLLDRARPDDGARAAELLTEALTEYRRLGMPGYAEEVERMLVETQSVG